MMWKRNRDLKRKVQEHKNVLCWDVWDCSLIVNFDYWLKLSRNISLSNISNSWLHTAFLHFFLMLLEVWRPKSSKSWSNVFVQLFAHIWDGFKTRFPQSGYTSTSCALSHSSLQQWVKQMHRCSAHIDPSPRTPLSMLRSKLTWIFNFSPWDQTFIVFFSTPNT